MSAFIVSEKTMHRAVQAMDINQAACEYLDWLGREMYALNQEAVQQRYGVTDPVPQYRYRRVFTTRIQLYKSLQCLRYQCSEGDIPDKSILYKQISDRINQLAGEIVASLPEYDRADWD